MSNRNDTIMNVAFGALFVFVGMAIYYAIVLAFRLIAMLVSTSDFQKYKLKFLNLIWKDDEQKVEEQRASNVVPFSRPPASFGSPPNGD